MSSGRNLHMLTVVRVEAIKMSEEPKRREWPFFNLMDVYFSDQVNDPTLRLFSSTKRFDSDTLDDAQFDDEIMNSTAAAAIAAAAAASAAAANAASQHKIKNELIATHGHSGGSMLDISDIIGDEHGESNTTSTSSNSSGRDEASSLNSSPTSHMSGGGPVNGPCGPEMGRKMSNGPAADFSALLAAANSHTNGTLHSSALSSIDRDTDYDDIAERSSLYDGGNSHLKSLNQKLLHQMNEHHNIDQYLLSWRGFHGNMCKGFHSLQRDGQMVDVTIAAGGKIFKAHKLVLSVCSPYFQKIFLEHPSQHPILFMTDVNSHHMAGLLDFMYSGQVNVKYEDLPNFLKVAEALQVKGLHGEPHHKPGFDSINSLLII
uniref:BTB domain-containing protein n=1 Tax=Anopheles atroparvus TaxID=41427 RepID=A0A182JN81_ANOAO